MPPPTSCTVEQRAILDILKSAGFPDSPVWESRTDPVRREEPSAPGTEEIMENVDRRERVQCPAIGWDTVTTLNLQLMEKRSTIKAKTNNLRIPL